MNYPNVVNEWDTIDYLVKNKCSIARYGDGELKLCLARAAKSQCTDPELQERLRYILRNPHPACLVGIPNIGDMSIMSERKQEFWRQYNVSRYTGLYDFNKTYHSSFITRPDSAPSIAKAAYWDKVKELWKDRDVLLVQGEESNFDKTRTLFSEAASITDYVTVARDAWDKRHVIMDEILKHFDETLIVFSLGPTATVLAYDLALLHGYQSLDLGHMGMFYAKKENHG